MNKEDAWAKANNFHDRTGRCLVEFEVIEGPEKGKKVYKGKINLKIQVQVSTPAGPQIQVQERPFDFDFPEGKTFNYCRNHFDEEANSAVNEFKVAQKKAQEEARREAATKVVGPGFRGAVLGPDGRPVQLKG